MNSELGPHNEWYTSDLYHYIRNRLGEKLESQLTENWDSVRTRGVIAIVHNGAIYKVTITKEEL